MMTADKDRLDLLLMETFELFCHIGSCRVAGQGAVVEVASYQEEIWPVVKSKVDQHVEAVLKVSLPLEPSGTILDGGGVEVVVGCQKHMNRHYTLSSQATRTVRIPVQLLGSILNLEEVEPEPCQAVTPPYHPRFRHSNIPLV